MIRVPNLAEDDPIDYLIRRKFGASIRVLLPEFHEDSIVLTDDLSEPKSVQWWWDRTVHGATTESAINDAVSAGEIGSSLALELTEHLGQIAQIRAFFEGLRSLSREDLSVRVEAERVQEQQERIEQAEARERAAWYSQPYAQLGDRASHWLMMDVWTPEEAAILLLGLDPRFASDEKLRRSYGSLPERYSDLVDLLRRSRNPAFANEARPEAYIGWATAREFNVPEALQGILENDESEDGVSQIPTVKRTPGRPQERHFVYREIMRHYWGGESKPSFTVMSQEIRKRMNASNDPGARELMGRKPNFPSKSLVGECWRALERDTTLVDALQELAPKQRP